MTLQEIRESDKLFLNANDIAKVCGCTSQKIREQARRRPELLGFSVTVTGHRVKIPRKQFLRYIDGAPYREEST